MAKINITFKGKKYVIDESVLSTAIADLTTAFVTLEEASNPKVSEGLEFTSNGDGTCYVSGIGTCADTDVVIPSTSPDGDSVTSIGESAFQWCESLTSVVIPDSVTSIGDWAFMFCESLTSITIPEGVTSIGKEAFYVCSSLEAIEIPDSVTSIGDGAFNQSGLKSVVIPNGITRIGDSMFNTSALTSITIPDSVTSIGTQAFANCRLTSIIFNGTTAQWNAINKYEDEYNRWDNWNYNCSAICVQCTDGQVEIEACKA